jgi:polar amino acid transport system permease protein
MATFFDVNSVLQVRHLLLQGLAVSALLIVTIIPLAMLGGLLIAVVQKMGDRIGRTIAVIYIDFFRAFPPLVLLIFLYSGLPVLGLRMSEIQTVIIGLSMNGAAFFAEIFRAGFDAVTRGQWDAGHSLGLRSMQVLRLIVLPQSLKIVVPPLASNVIELAKATSLAAAVSLPDLLTSARQAQDIVFNPSPLVAVGLIYLVVFWPLVRLMSRLEVRSFVTR